VVSVGGGFNIPDCVVTVDVEVVVDVEVLVGVVVVVVELVVVGDDVVAKQHDNINNNNVLSGLVEENIDAFDQLCLRRILKITWLEHVTNFEVRRRTGQPLLSDTVRTRRLKLFGQSTWLGRTSLKIIPVLYKPACICDAHSKELEAESRSSKTYMAEDGGGRSAPIQSWSRVRLRRAQYRTAWRTFTGTAIYVTDKLRLMMMMMMMNVACCPVYQ